MPASDAGASVTRDGEALRFAGALVRDQVPALWRQALPLVGGARRFDLAGASRVDSAGVALLAELATLAGRGGGGAGDGVAHPGVLIEGHPPGLAELRAAYRLKPDLDFA
jgi:phospholipid transport system transporter-binding protein